VIYSAWKVAASDWVRTSSNNRAVKAAFILAPEVTPTIIDSGLVIVYLRFQASLVNPPQVLPYTSYDAVAPASAYTVSAYPTIETIEPVTYTPVPFNRDISAGTAIPAANQSRIRLLTFTHDNTGNSSVISSAQYRYIIVPGGVAAAASANSKGLNWQDYSSVKRYFNLPD
jgi:hypothetical protein